MIAIIGVVIPMLLMFIWTAYLVFEGDDLEQLLAVIPFMFFCVFAVFTHTAIRTTLMGITL